MGNDDHIGQLTALVNELVDRVNHLGAQLEVAFTLLEEANLAGTSVNGERIDEMRARANAAMQQGSHAAPPSEEDLPADERTTVERRVIPSDTVVTRGAVDVAGMQRHEGDERLHADQQRNLSTGRAVDMLENWGKKK